MFVYFTYMFPIISYVAPIMFQHIPYFSYIFHMGPRILGEPFKNRRCRVTWLIFAGLLYRKMALMSCSCFGLLTHSYRTS